MSNYGPIDILWYDMAWPLSTPKLWESAKMNAMARRLQPEITINNRSLLPEDFGTSEERIQAEGPGRAWEARMTFNGSWGYFPTVGRWLARYGETVYGRVDRIEGRCWGLDAWSSERSPVNEEGARAGVQESR